MSSGSWMMPRSRNHDQTRLTRLRANHGFFGEMSQSAKTTRGSRPSATLAGVPSGNVAASLAGFAPSFYFFFSTGSAGVVACSRVFVASVAVLAGSKKTISSFHSPVCL